MAVEVLDVVQGVFGGGVGGGGGGGGGGVGVCCYGVKFVQMDEWK